MNLWNLLLRDSSPQLRKHHFRRISIPRTGVHQSCQPPQQGHASLHHKRQHISPLPMVIMPRASAFHRVPGIVHLHPFSYSFISIHNKISKKLIIKAPAPFLQQARPSCKEGSSPPLAPVPSDFIACPSSLVLHRLSLIACSSSPIIAIHPSLLPSLSPSSVPLSSAKAAPGLPFSQRCDAPSPYTYKKSRNPHPR